MKCVACCVSIMLILAGCFYGSIPTLCIGALYLLACCVLWVLDLPRKMSLRRLQVVSTHTEKLSA